MMGGESTPSYYGNNTITGNWVYPYPYLVEAFRSDASFFIYAVDNNGLPTEWNIKMMGEYGYTGKIYYNFETTSQTDKIYGVSEYGSNWSGEITSNQAGWKVRSVVPEPETYSLMLAGLSLIGLVIRNRQKRNTLSFRN